MDRFDDVEYEILEAPQPAKATTWDGRHHHGCRKGDRRRHDRERRSDSIENLGLRH